jgi:hypothetical protein
MNGATIIGGFVGENLGVVGGGWLIRMPDDEAHCQAEGPSWRLGVESNRTLLDVDRRPVLEALFVLFFSLPSPAGAFSTDALAPPSVEFGELYRAVEMGELFRTKNVRRRHSQRTAR